MDSVKPPRKHRTLKPAGHHKQAAESKKPADSTKPADEMPLPASASVVELEANEVDELLADASPAGDKAAETESTKKPKKKPKKKRRFTWKRAILAVLLLIVSTGGFFGVKLFLAARNIIAKNSVVAPALTGDTTKLKGEGDGRVNILLMGVGGGDHAGGTLSDTMMVVSLDVKTKNVAILGIPRDLYVPIPGYGYNKINAANAFGEQYKLKGGGGDLAKKTVENVLGVPIHYYARIDFNGFKKAIDVVGGVDIDVPQALYDPSYPCDNNQYRSCGFKITTGPHHMDGNLALKYTRCRKGNCGDDYGRAARQQMVLLALRQKALSLGTLANPAKVAGLLDVVGDGFKTDLQLAEMKKLVELGKQVDTSKIVNKVLTNDGDNPLVQNADMGAAGSVVIPTAGNGIFTKIRAFVRTLFADSYILTENARIEVQNGTTRSGLAATVGDILKSYQYNVITVTTADRQDYTKTILYDYTKGAKPITVRYLENRFGVTATKADPVSGGPDVRIILGSDYKQSTGD